MRSARPRHRQQRSTRQRTARCSWTKAMRMQRPPCHRNSLLWRLACGERRFDAVLAQHPDHLVTRSSRAFLFGAVGRMREAARERLVVARAAPLDADIQYGQIYGLWFLDRIDGGRSGCRSGNGDVAAASRASGSGGCGSWRTPVASTGPLPHIDDQVARPPAASAE